MIKMNLFAYFGAYAEVRRAITFCGNLFKTWEFHGWILRYFLPLYRLLNQFSKVLKNFICIALTGQNTEVRRNEGTILT